MVIGYLNAQVENAKSKADVYELVREFVEEFKAKHGSINCRELLDCDWNSEEGRKEAEKRNFREQCLVYVQDSVELLENRYF